MGNISKGVPIIPNLSSKPAGSLFEVHPFCPEICWSPVLPIRLFIFFFVLQEASGTNGSFEFNAFFSACQSRLQCHVLVRLMGVDGGGEGGDLDNVRLTPPKFNMEPENKSLSGVYDLDIFRLCGGETMGFIWHPWDDWYIIPDMNGGILYGKCR